MKTLWQLGKVFLLLILLTGSQSGQELNEAKQYGYSSQYGAVTPSHVYAVLQQFNQALLFAAKQSHHGAAQAMQSQTLQIFTAKTPKDTFNRLNQLANATDALLPNAGLPPIARVTPETASAIPAEVYLLAKHTLDKLLLCLQTKYPKLDFDTFFDTDQPISGKTPSDVYSQIDLAMRQLQLLKTS